MVANGEIPNKWGTLKDPGPLLSRVCLEEVKLASTPLSSRSAPDLFPIYSDRKVIATAEIIIPKKGDV